MLKCFVLIALATIALGEEAESPQVNVEEGVLVATTENFESVINSNEFVLVEFYAPWCGHCKNLAPEYAKAAQQLDAEEAGIKLAKVDATVEKDLGSKFGVRGYPTLRFFRSGEPMEYNGPRDAAGIVTWLKKKTGPAAVTLSTKEDAEKLLKNEVAVVGFFKDLEGDAAKTFMTVAGGNDDLQFGITNEESLFGEYKVEVDDAVVVFKKFDSGRDDMTEDFTKAAMKKFVDASSTPLVTEFSQQAAQKLFASKDTPFMFLIMSKKSDAYPDVAEALRASVLEKAGEVKAVFLNTDDKTSSQVINYMGVQPDQYPCIRMLNLDKGLKYQPESSELTKESISAFISAFLNGELKPFLKSESIPDDWDKEDVKVLVGKNFKEVALDDSKHVLVEFYAPWCGHCKKLAPIWDELGALYAGNDDVVIAKMDSTANEVEEVSIKGFPTLKFFPANSDGKIVDYSGGRTLEDLTAFLAKYSAPPSKEAEQKEEGDDSKEDEDDSSEEEQDEMKKDEL